MTQQHRLAVSHIQRISPEKQISNPQKIPTQQKHDTNANKMKSSATFCVYVL